MGSYSAEARRRRSVATECAYCGCTLGKVRTLDHRVPKSKGGRTSLKNLVVCCEPCNADKADSKIEEWARRSWRGQSAKERMKLEEYHRYEPTTPRHTPSRDRLREYEALNDNLD